MTAAAQIPQPQLDRPPKGDEALYALQDAARFLQPSKNARKCNRVRCRKHVEIAGGRLNGLVHCQSASCPVFVDRRAREHISHDSRILRQALDNGRRMLLLTLSVDEGNQLAALLSNLDAEWRHLISGNPWRRWRNRLGLEFIRGRVEEYHEGHWRAYIRVALVLAGTATEQSEFLIWLRHRWHGNVQTSVSQDADGAAGWLTPRVDALPALPGKPRTPWQTISEDADLFREWAFAIRRRKRHELSAGFESKDHHDGKRHATLVEAASEDLPVVEPPQPSPRISGPVWDVIRDVPSFSRTRLIIAAETGGQAEVDRICKQLLAEAAQRNPIFPVDLRAMALKRLLAK